MADVVTHSDGSAKPGEFAAFLESREPKQPEAPTLPLEPTAHVVVTPSEDPSNPPAERAAAFEDPETGEPIEKPTRGDKRIKRLWSEREEARQRAERAEQRLAELEAGRTTARPEPAATAHTEQPAPDTLTQAAQSRIRAKPDRAAIGTTYATYEDYVEDCAIWGGELAAEKRALLAEQQTQEARVREAQSSFATAVSAAKPDYPDFDEVVNAEIPINQAIWDGTVNAGDLAGHVLYYLGQHPEETRAIAAMEPGAALVAMGEIRATVRAARTAKAAPAAEPDPKPRTSRAPAPLTPVPRHGGAPTRPEQIAEAGGSAVDFIRMRNEETRRRF